MGEIVPVSSPLKAVKNKKVLLFGGLGVAAAVVVMVVRGAGGGSGDPVVEAVAERDQSVSVLGSQIAALESSMKEQNNAISEQFDTVDQTINYLGESFVSFQEDISAQQTSLVGQLNSTGAALNLLGDRFVDLQNSAADDRESLVSELVKLQRSQETTKSSSSSSFSPSSSGYNGQSDKSYSDYSIKVAKGSALDNSGSGSNNFRISNDSFSKATDLDTAIKSGKASGSFSIVENGGKLYNVDNETGKAYKTW